MLYFQICSFLFLVLSRYSVHAEAARQCIPTQHAIEIFTTCGKENKDDMMKLIVCVLKKENIIDDNFVVNKEATMNSIQTLLVTDKITAEQMKMGYETCFVGFSGDASQCQRTLECLHYMKKLACGEPFTCNNEETKEKCQPTEQAIQIFLDCMKAENISSLESLESAENADKKIPLYTCFLKEARILDDNYIVNQEKTMESIDTLLITDPETHEKLVMTYQACLKDFKGGPADTPILLKCIDKMKKWACGEKLDDECKENENEECYCKANLDEIIQATIKCVPPSSDGRKATEFSKDELNTAIEQNKDQVLKCTLKSKNMLNEDDTLYKQGFYDFFEKILETDANTMDLMRYQIDQCFLEADKCEQSSESLNKAWECSLEFVKKICKKQ